MPVSLRYKRGHMPQVKTTQDASLKQQPPSDYISDQQFAAMVGVHRTSIWRWVRTDATCPQPVRIGPATTRFCRSAVVAWLASKSLA